MGNRTACPAHYSCAAGLLTLRLGHYSVLAHEALIDDAWPSHIALLLKKFPRTSAAGIAAVAGVRMWRLIADETFADLLSKLQRRKFASVSPGLRRALTRHYADPATRTAPQ
jgi:hypothetical protein